MVRYAVIALVFLLPVCATAQGQSTAPPPPIPLEFLCRDLVAYQPETGIDYQEGVDSRGRPVMGAGTEDTVQMDVPDMTYVSVTLDQAAQLGLPVQSGFTPYAYVGEVMVNKYGDVYFNDKRISHTQMQALCTDMNRR